MAISKAITTGQETPDLGDQVIGFYQEFIFKLSNAIDQFFKWERERILIGDPTPAEQEQHRRTLKLFLQLMGLFQFATRDPDFPDRALKELIGTQLSRLEQSWEMVYNPMPEEEAKKLLTEVFPNEPLLKELFPDGPRP